MIKKIPIKGISRDPSGQTSAEGMCAESFNVQLDMGEVSPMIAPQNITSEYAGSGVSQVAGEPLFIHKGNGYKNLICKSGSGLISYPGGSSITGFSLASGETISDIKSVGNTLIVATNLSIHYILYNSVYKYLGTRIPVPNISFRIGGLSVERTLPEATAFSVPSTDPDLDWQAIENTFYEGTDVQHKWTGDKEPFDNVDFTTDWGGPGTKYKTREDWQQAFLDAIWGFIDEKLADANNDLTASKAIFPFFIRYAVRLYDGSCYAQSIPIMLGADLLRFVDINAFFYERRYTLNASVWNNAPLDCNFLLANIATAEPFAVYATFPGSTFSNWKDIVTSVDIFISDQFLPGRDAIKIEQVGDAVSHTDENGFGIYTYLSYQYVLGKAYLDPYYTEEHQEELAMLHQTTYLAKSYTVDEFDALSGEVCLSDIDYSADTILTREHLKETSQSMHTFKSEELFTYNNRLMLGNSVQSLSHGYPWLPAVKWELQSVSDIIYKFIFYIKSDNGEATVFSRNSSGSSEYISPQNKDIITSIAHHETPVAWVAYPDSRCYKVEIIRRSGSGSSVTYTKVVLSMNAATEIDVAYAFIGFGQEFAFASYTERSIYESEQIHLGNKIVVSNVNNPFLFPTQNHITFNVGKIFNLAVATTPLSEGQAGQFPLYVFTDEGVQALSVNSQGDFMTSHTVTRDVILSKDAICAIEQGVFFAAARGLLLLQGSRVEKVSILMDGPVATIEDTTLVSNIQSIIGNSVAYVAGGLFHEFLNGSKMMYDYANKRIIIFRTDTSSCYVYKIDTQSWHRMKAGALLPVRALNSYPEASLVVGASGAYSVMDYSILPESEGAVALPGVIYTRDLSLDSPDVYKTINRLKIRGRYVNGLSDKRVKYAVQGSNDGITYYTLKSLRGPSWKWYRIAIALKLGAKERVSYIEIDYQPKFTDKIR